VFSFVPAEAQNIFYRPREKQAQADQSAREFFQPEGDHLTLLAVYEAWKAKSFWGRGALRTFCKHARCAARRTCASSCSPSWTGKGVSVVIQVRGEGGG